MGLQILLTLVMACLQLTLLHGREAEAQALRYDLASYRTDDLIRNEMFVLSDLSASSDWRESTTTFAERTENGWSTSGRLSLTFKRLEDRQRAIRNLLLTISLDPSASDFEIEPLNADEDDRPQWIENSDRAFGVGAGAEGDHRQYFWSPYFWQLDMASIFNRRRSTDETNSREGTGESEVRSAREATETRRTYYLDVSAGIGAGRLYPLQDARRALYILDGLSEIGMLARPATTQDIEALSNLVRSVLNERIFDSRIKRMKETTQLVRFLEGRGLIATAGVEAVVSIDDSFRLANAPVRETGAELFAGFGLRFDDARFESESEETENQIPSRDSESLQEYEDRDVFGFVAFTRAVPLSNNLQWDQVVRLEAGQRTEERVTWSRWETTDQIRESRDLRDLEVDYIDVMGSAALRYFPTSRDELTVTLEAMYRDEDGTVDWIHDDFDTLEDTGRTDSEASLSLSWSRYLTLKTLLTIRAH